ncbi:rhodanese-like domain-containing protein [Gillisia sp. Q332]|uniref:rhodanese-like domain-containing protein n=1 Tax=Gillisia xinjiangensis TaxID=3384765 RepID=UPI00391B905D
MLLFLLVSCKQNTKDSPELSSKTKSDEQNIISTENGGNLTPLEVKDLIRDNPDLIIIDVRTPQELELGMVENAINIDMYDQNFLLEIKKLGKGQKYLLYCSVGGRSSATLEIMKKEGFSSVFNSKKGFASLKEAGIAIKE